MKQEKIHLWPFSFSVIIMLLSARSVTMSPFVVSGLFCSLQVTLLKYVNNFFLASSTLSISQSRSTLGIKSSALRTFDQWRNQVGAEGAERPPGQQFWGNFQMKLISIIYTMQRIVTSIP